MAAIDAVNSIYLCHFCSKEFSNDLTLHYHSKTCIKSNETQVTTLLFDQIQEKMLQMIQLRPVTNSSSSHSSPRSLILSEETLQIPLSNLYAKGYVTSSKQNSFNDDDCAINSIDSIDENIPTEKQSNDKDDDDGDETLFHRYKYSRRERRQIKRAVMKKIITPVKIVREKDPPSIFADQKHFQIQIPTQIFSRQQISSTTNVLYPLLFDPNYSHLVQLPSDSIFDRHLNEMNIFFHLIHSIASQEFQYIIHHHDHQHQLSYTPYSMIHLFRQTLLESNQNFKRTFSQTFSSQNDQETTIPPLKIRRYDHSSYEIKNRSTASSSSSASSGMSITQINHAQTSQGSDFDRRRSGTRPKKFANKLSDQQTNSNFHPNNDHDRRDPSDYSSGSPSQNDSTTFDHHSDRNGTIDPFLSTPNISNGTSPNLIRESTHDSHPPKYQSVVLNDGARIRIVNCSNDNSKASSTRLSHFNANKRSSNQSMDENGSTKMTRLHTRKISSSNSKTAEITDVSSSLYPTHALGLTNSEIARQWLTHCVFYRCHACSHEEFFVVFSRECMRLHVSSQHGNMEENFKQRLSNFLNNQGRALKIFQHYLKWQQPWSEKEIDQLFQLSNVPSTRTNGAL